jgi:NAD(P)-dependent dehydrogenase (short-subunit alcohol dehydrogenase family)
MTEQRTVLVTGGSRGIGAAIARAFAKDGCRVAVHYGASRRAAEDVLASLPGTGHTLAQADLADPAAVRSMVDGVAATFGRIDVLVNNAGVFTAHAIESTDYEDWQAAWTEHVNVNLIGAANVTWCALQHMPRHGSSRIVNVGSRGAFRTEPKNPAYGATKAALAAFGQSIAKALGSEGIAVTTIAPGFVETDMAAEYLATRGDEIRGDSPFNRVATPDEVAAGVLFLASPQAEWASGTVLDFNGASWFRL